MDAPMIGHSLLCASEHDGHARLNICGLQKWGHKYPSMGTITIRYVPTACRHVRWVWPLPVMGRSEVK